MPDDDFEELKKAHEFYQDILEHNPADINKDFKEKYELKSKLFEYHKENRKSTAIARWITYIALFFLILFIILIILDTL
jgi:hypothetical protein